MLHSLVDSAGSYTSWQSGCLSAFHLQNIAFSFTFVQTLQEDKR